MNRFSKRAFQFSSQKRALLETLLQREGVAAPPLPDMARKENQASLPLSFAQQRLWFLDQWAPGLPVYHICRAFSLLGRLDLAAFARGLAEVVHRHEVLRTTFVLREDQPLQVLAPDLPELLFLVDLADLAEEERAARTRHLMAEAAHHPFDLARGPLLRVHLLRLSGEKQVLLLIIHHTVCDGWSLDLFLHELSVLYQVYATEQPSPLPDLLLQYADYALWQREHLRGEALEAQLAYWRRRFKDAPAMLQLPADHPRPSVQTFQGTHLLYELPPKLALALKELSQREGATLFMTLLATFAALLARYSRQEDLLIGTPTANRLHKTLEPLIGCFANTLALRLDLAGRPTFRDLLARVRERCLEAYAHQELPFEKLVEELVPERASDHTPLLQVMFALQHMPQETLQLSGLTVSDPMQIETNTARMDLLLTVVETPDGLSASFEYSTDLFEAATITRMASHFQTLLEGIVADPQGRPLEIPLLSEAEQLGLFQRRGPSRPSLAQEGFLLHQLIEAQSERTPDALALGWEDEHLTYGALNRRANQLAHSLLRLGEASGERLVGVCLPRSPELVIALLAVLKIGGTYLPLDPDYPAERLAFMLRDSQASVVLTHQPLAAFSELPCRLLSLDQEAVYSENEANPVCPTSAEQLAYVIYTSGSTGQPKGIMLTHRGALALLSWVRDHFSARQLARVLASTSICFDLSIFELWGTLSVGGAVLLTRDVLQGSSWAAEQAATLLNTVPSALSALLSLGALPSSLRVVNLAGEPLSASLVRWIYAQGNIEQVYNLYGPGEDTTYSTWALVPAESDDPIPIGRPIPGTEAYLLDDYGQLAPVGVIGELYLAGEGLARGYLQRPALTAERFVPHPWSRRAGERLYRTGDLARARPDGSLEFVGREDSQVKLRGYRIELGEIEAALLAHPQVHEAAVLVREEASGEKYLVAYVASRELPGAPGELRNYLAESLPAYMVPAAWVMLERFPHLPNGKVKRETLPAPEQFSPDATASYVAPRTPLEEMLAALWSAVLGRERVGIHDNFFEIGGHSLLATRVVARLREALRHEVSLRSLFEAPTVAGLARRLEGSLRGAEQRSVPPLTSAPRPTPLPLSFAQQRLWFLDQLEPGIPAYNMPFARRLRGTLRVNVLERALNEIVRRHEILRTTFALAADSPVQLISPFLPPAFLVMDLSALPPLQREPLAARLASQQALLPFDLARGPLLRVMLLRLEAEEYVLLLSMHHILADGWSLELFQRELTLLYQAFAAGRASPLPKLPVQYADYALWQRRWLHGQVHEALTAYWRQQLGSVPPGLELPTDRPRPPVQTWRGAHYRFSLSQQLSRALLTLSRHEGATLFMALLSAWQVLLFRYSGQDDLLIGTPIANRVHPELETLIGCFVNTLILRGDLAGDPSFLHLLKRTRERTLDAYVHQDLPFEQVVEALHPQRDLSHTPLFQVMFVLQNVPSQASELPGLRLLPFEVEQTTARFDLTLLMQETDQGLRAMLEYNTDLFESATIARLALLFQRLLEGIVADPELTLSQLPLLTGEEQQQVLALCNPAPQVPERERCLHQLFEAQVEQTPHAIALAWQDEQLTYEELNERANFLASQLQARGVGPDVRVGLCLERSLEMVVGLMAILKAGGVYVPLDPAYPAQRLAFLLSDAQVAVLLTQQRFLTQLPQQRGPGLSLDIDSQALAGRSATPPPSGITARHLAYMIYTSGSTGQPKGTLIPHQGFCDLAQAQVRAFGVHPGDRVLQLASLSFDASIWEIVMALGTGATLHLANQQSLLPGRALVQLLREQAITVMTISPSALALVPVEAFPALHTIITAGETCSAELVATWGAGRRFFNAYGPTETTICATLHQCDERTGRPPIGRPIPGTLTYVLDTHMQPVPIGVPGELYVGGRGVAHGYHNRPDLTAERFVPDPFSKTPGTRLYRTGDLVRVLPDGVLLCLGRLDQQVKLRGYRIELGEIEAVLRTHPAVREAVVVVREDASGDRRLLAYLVPQPGQRPTVSELRSSLQARLPGYMVPATFLFLEHLPLTPNGKLDRRALPDPGAARPGLAEQYVAPRTPVEELLVDIWGQVLGLTEVGIYDNFFELGGHSLLATQALSRIRDTFRLELPLHALFAAPTVAGLARSLTEHETIAGQVATLARLHKKMAGLSPDEMRQALQNKREERKRHHE